MKRFFVLCIIFITLFIGYSFYQKALSQNGKSIVVETAKGKRICVIGKKADTFPFYVYQDGNSPENKFFASGLMGDFNDLKVDLYSKDNPQSGGTCAKIVYKKTPENIGWAGLYWQYPANNWGEMATGYDLRAAKKLTFWARGEKGGEVINIFQVGGIFGKYGDTTSKAIGPVVLSKDWTKYTIDLTVLDYSIVFGREFRECWPFMEPLSRIIGGFGWAAALDANEWQDITFYLDEIKFED